MPIYFINFTYEGSANKEQKGTAIKNAVNNLEAVLILKKEYKNARIKNIIDTQEAIGSDYYGFFNPEGEGEAQIENFSLNTI